MQPAGVMWHVRAQEARAPQHRHTSHFGWGGNVTRPRQRLYVRTTSIKASTNFAARVRVFGTIAVSQDHLNQLNRYDRCQLNRGGNHARAYQRRHHQHHRHRVYASARFWEWVNPNPNQLL